MFRTLQDRLPKELALAEIKTIEAANLWIAQVYLPRHNARFAVPAAEDGSAFVAVAQGQWRDVLCVQEGRQVGADNTVRWRGRSLQLPPSPERAHYVRANVRVHAYPDGALAVFHGPRRIACFPPDEPSATTATRSLEPTKGTPPPPCAAVAHPVSGRASDGGSEGTAPGDPNPKQEAAMTP